MKKIFILFAVALFATASCSENIIKEDIIKIVDIKGVENDAVINLGDTVSLVATAENINTATYQWVLNDKEVIGEESSLKYVTKESGQHSITLNATNESGTDSKKILFNVVKGASSSSSKWISEIIEYRPAPGQFINKSPGNMASAQGIVGKKGMVTLGAFGGYIVFCFDHTVINQEGDDFVIHGNAMGATSSEPGGVMVSYDVNGNGKADDEWYELKGSEYDKSIKDYEITYQKPSQTEKSENVLWSDNQGESGKVTAISFHRQCYYPLFLEDNPSPLKFKAVCAPKNSVQVGTNWELHAFKSGYVDNVSEDYPKQVGEDSDTKNSNKFDISNAIDKEGNPVVLKAIDFIKVYTCVNQEAGWLGETSTEVCGAISLTKSE